MTVREHVCAERSRSSLVGLFILVLVLAACSSTPVPTASPVDLSVTVTASPNIACVDLPQVQPNTCDTVIAAVRETHAQDAYAASRLLVATTCPPQVGCEGPFFYDLVVLLVPPSGDTEEALSLHVFGHIGESLQVEPWSGPLPSYVADLLAQGS